MKTPFQLVYLLIAICCTIGATAQQNYHPYKLELRIKGGEVTEGFRQQDPGGRLSKSAVYLPFFGVAAMYHRSHRQRIGIEYNRLPIGRSPFFPDANSAPYTFVDANFNELSLVLEQDLITFGKQQRFHLWAAIAPAFTFTGFPDATGGSTRLVMNNADTLFFIEETNGLHTGSFFSLKALTGLRYDLARRFSIGLNLGYALNISAPRVAWTTVNYRHPALPNRQAANIDTRGNLATITLSLSYHLYRHR